MFATKYFDDHFDLRTGVVIQNSVLYLPIGSMYGIFTYIYHKNQPYVGKYTIHGWYGYLSLINHDRGIFDEETKIAKIRRFEIIQLAA